MQNKNKIAILSAFTLTTLGAIDLGVIKVENELGWNLYTNTSWTISESIVRVYHHDLVSYDGTNYTNWTELKIPHWKTNGLVNIDYVQNLTNIFAPFNLFTNLNIPDGTNQITVRLKNFAGLESEETDRYDLQFYMSKPYAPSKLMLFKYMEAVAEIELQKPIVTPPTP